MAAPAPTLRKQIQTHLEVIFQPETFIVVGERNNPNRFHVEVNPVNVDDWSTNLHPGAVYAQEAVEAFGGVFVDEGESQAWWRPGEPVIGAFFTLNLGPIIIAPVIEEPPVDPEDTRPDVAVHPIEKPKEEEPELEVIGA